jgi:hypothetical protein
MDVNVKIDDRVRLLMAVLAASDWPEWEQTQATHAVHQHSKQTRHFVREFGAHAAVTGLNRALANDVTLDELFTAALRCSWPSFEPFEPLPDALGDGTWVSTLTEFYQATSLDRFWAEHETAWDTAQTDLVAIFEGSQIIPFLNQLRNTPLSRSITITPSIVYPMLVPVMAETATSLFFVLPPAKAWGESPPWPFGEDPGWVMAQTCWHLSTQFLLEPLSKLDETRQTLLRHAVVTLCLEVEFDEGEAMAYLVRSKKEHGLPRLPLVVENLRTYLADPAGRSLLDMDF